MANIGNCTIKDVYKNFLTVRGDNKLKTGSGNLFLTNIGIKGAVTGSIQTEKVLAVSDGNRNTIEFQTDRGGLLIWVDSKGILTFIERSSDPAPPANGSGSIAFVNNTLKFYGDI